MTNLSDDVALKIALAARALADVEVGDLLEGILMLVGEPLTLAKLKKIRLGKLKQLECYYYYLKLLLSHFHFE